jgi:hypothetical protein
MSRDDGRARDRLRLTGVAAVSEPLDSSRAEYSRKRTWGLGTRCRKPSRKRSCRSCALSSRSRQIVCHWQADNDAIARLFPIGVLAGEMDLVGAQAADGSIIEDPTPFGSGADSRRRVRAWVDRPQAWSRSTHSATACSSAHPRSRVTGFRRSDHVEGMSWR